MRLAAPFGVSLVTTHFDVAFNESDGPSVSCSGSEWPASSGHTIKETAIDGSWLHIFLQPEMATEWRAIGSLIEPEVASSVSFALDFRADQNHGRSLDSIKSRTA